MARFFVRSFPQNGFDGVYTPHRFWHKDGTFIETVDQDDDPHENTTKPDGSVTAFAPKTTEDGAVLVGRSTLKLLQEDNRFAVGLEGAAVHKLESLASENDALKARIAELEAAAAGGGKKKNAAAASS